ncbi:hypothetical protein LXA43DRAFT_1187876 [Ganoderma leucocontextum]|nr:hypothetical protein LXA43DRAFT_1187876 [Ganoderma leucocontextum]
MTSTNIQTAGASVFLIKQQTLTKDDKSPVTVGDCFAQAVVNTILDRTFPDDPIVDEEDAADLRAESGKTPGLSSLPTRC